MDQTALNMQAMQNQMKKRSKRKQRVSNKEFGDFGSIFDNNLTHKVQRNKSPFVKKEAINDSPLIKNSNNDKSSQGSCLDSSIQSSGSSDYQFKMKLGLNNKKKRLISAFEEKKKSEESVESSQSL